MSWFLHGNEAMSINQWKGVEGIKCSSNTDVCITTGEQVLDRLTFKEVIKCFNHMKILICALYHFKLVI